MNVLLINGSPHKEGCTYHALCEVAKTLNAAGIETTIYHIGPAPVGGCVGCGGCAKAGHCVFGGPVVDVLPLVEKADGIVFYEMPLVSSTYWPMVHGTSGDQVALDEEGCQIMRNLGTNMAWRLKCIEAGKAAGVEVPTAEGGKRTNFIR